MDGKCCAHHCREALHKKVTNYVVITGVVAAEKKHMAHELRWSLVAEISGRQEFSKSLR